MKPPLGRSRRRWLWAVVASSTLALGSCLSPTLPLPPPSEPTIEGPTAEGKVTLSGSVGESGAHVQAANMRLRQSWGQFTQDNGDFSIVIDAQVGDEVLLWYAIGYEQSPTTIIVIPEPQ
jgi:hypothetical protein